MAVHWHLDGFWLFCGRDGLVSPLSSYVCFLRTDGGVLLNATHIRLPVQAWTAVGARKRITATLSPNASRRSHIKRALMCCNPATICQGGPGTVPGQERGPGSCSEPEVLQVNVMNVNAAQLELISLCCVRYCSIFFFSMNIQFNLQCLLKTQFLCQCPAILSLLD